MTKKELIEWYQSIYTDKMPRYIEVSDANDSQVRIEKTWKNVIFSWSVFSVGEDWKYVETDDERGYVNNLSCFKTEEETAEYAKEILSKKHLALNGNARAEMLCRYISQQYGYSEKRSKRMINQMSDHDDIFEEFFNYARVGKLCKKDKSKTEVCGYTAETLYKDYGFSPLGAYNYLMYLQEDPVHALADLKAGLSRK